MGIQTLDTRLESMPPFDEYSMYVNSRERKGANEKHADQVVG